MSQYDDEENPIAAAIGDLATKVKSLGNGDAATAMGAIEAHGVAVKEASETIASALRELAEAIRDSAS